MSKALTAICLFSSLLAAQHGGHGGQGKDPVKEPAKEQPAKPAAKLEVIASYPLKECIVSGETLGDDAVDVEVAGRRFRLCCKDCKAKLTKDADGYVKKLDEAIRASQRADYPLTTCPISGEELGGMGDPFELVLDGTLVRLCCGGCEKKARKKAAEVVAKVRNEARAKQAGSEEAKTCPVCRKDAARNGTPQEVLLGLHLVRLCSKDCLEAFRKDPMKYRQPAKGPASRPDKGEGHGDHGKDPGEGRGHGGHGGS
ncbi:MAG: hypothetical protein R3F30_03915 [Planctomycetota bacterium]